MEANGSKRIYSWRLAACPEARQSPKFEGSWASISSPALEFRHPRSWWSGEMNLRYIQDERPRGQSDVMPYFPCRRRPSVLFSTQNIRTGSPLGRRPQARELDRSWRNKLRVRPVRIRFRKCSKSGAGGPNPPDSFLPRSFRMGRISPRKPPRLEFIDGGVTRAPWRSARTLLGFSRPFPRTLSDMPVQWKTRNWSRVHAASSFRTTFRDLGGSPPGSRGIKGQGRIDAIFTARKKKDGR